MNKFIRFCIIITFTWVIVLFVLRAIQIKAEFDFIIQPPEVLIQGVLYFILTALGTFMWISLVKTKAIREKTVSNALFYYYLMTSTASTIQGISNVIKFLLGKLQTTLTDSVHFFLLSSGLALAIFILEVFQDGLEKERNKQIVAILSIIFIIAGITLTRMKLFDPSRIEIDFIMGISYSIILLLYAILSGKAFYLKKRIENTHHKIAFSYIGASGLLLLGAFFGIILINVFNRQNAILPFLDAAIFLVGYSFLYYGFNRLRKGSLRENQ